MKKVPRQGWWVNFFGRLLPQPVTIVRETETHYYFKGFPTQAEKAYTRNFKTYETEEEAVAGLRKRLQRYLQEAQKEIEDLNKVLAELDIKYGPPPATQD